MGITDVAAVANQIQKFWSPIFTPELRESHPLIQLADKKYSGEIKKGGDTVKVSQIVAVDAEIKTIGDSGYNTFDANALETRYVDVKADKIITAAVEVDDLADLQSQIGDKDSEIRAALLHGAMVKLNDFLYSKVSPSTTTPDHTFTDTDIEKPELIKYRKLASESHWVGAARYGLVSPEYWSIMLADEELTSADFAQDGQTVAGQTSMKRLGWNLLEDDSLSGKYALFFTPDFLHLAMQKAATFKLSDMHSNKQHGYLLSVSMVCGASLGIQGNLKHIVSAA
jgi:hypothetical protein